MAVLNVDGAELFYELKGRGRPAFVLVHGGMCDHRDWAPLVDRLSRRHAVLSLDLRAHGRSTGEAADCTIERWAQDLNAVIEAERLAPAVLVGHSLASRVVAEAAWASPDNVSGVVLLDGSRGHGGHAARAPRGGALTPPAGSLADILNVTLGPYMAGTARARVLATMMAASPEVMAACVSAMRDWDTARADTVFTGLRTPVLALQSTYHDPFTARRSLETADETTPYLDFLREAVGRVEIKGLAHTGHFSMIEHPEAVSERLLAFAHKIENRAGTT